MYICGECRHIFCEPKSYFERHGLDTPPYERWSVCPDCCSPQIYTYGEQDFD